MHIIDPVLQKQTWQLKSNSEGSNRLQTNKIIKASKRNFDNLHLTHTFKRYFIFFLAVRIKVKRLRGHHRECKQIRTPNTFGRLLSCGDLRREGRGRIIYFIPDLMRFKGREEEDAVDKKTD